jgi:hypothetical protein
VFFLLKDWRTPKERRLQNHSQAIAVHYGFGDVSERIAITLVLEQFDAPNTALPATMVR